MRSPESLAARVVLERCPCTLLKFKRLLLDNDLVA
jgi:hypothetical protein